MANENENDNSGNTNSVKDIVSDKKKLISNWWDQTTELYSQLVDNEDLEKDTIQQHLQKCAVDKKDEIFKDLNSLSNDIVSSVFEQVFGLPTHNPERLSDLLPVIIGPLKNPTEIHYMRCLENEGDIVWDTKGQFNCLFPESYLEKRNLKNLQLSKEAVAEDKDHKKFGLFFNDYTKYLTWKYNNNKKNQDGKDAGSRVTGSSAVGKSAGSNVADDFQYCSTYTKQFTDSEGKLQKEQIIERNFPTTEGLKVRIEKITYPSDGSTPKTEIEEKLISKK